MKRKITLLVLLLGSFGFAQQKTTGDITLSPDNGVSANFTLDNATSKVTLILKGPANKWFGMGIGVNQGFSMSEGDAIVYSAATTPVLTDRNFVGTQQPPVDDSQDWTIISDNVNELIRTVVLSRDLVTADVNDFQMRYETTNSIAIAGVRPPGVTTTVAPHGGTANVGYATANFTTLGVEDFSLNAAQVYPNPSKGNFMVKTKTALSKINVYTQTGALVKSINIENDSNLEVKVNGLSTGVYLLELQNASDKSWKKIIVE